MPNLDRCSTAAALCLALVSSLAPSLSARAGTADVDLQYVAKLAEARAREVYQRPIVELPESLGPEKLNYDGYRKIRYRHDRALWLEEKLPFRVEFYHPGYIYPDGVRIFEVSGSDVSRIPFRQDAFDYSDLEVTEKFPPETGYAGVKIAGAFGNPGEFPEFVSFLGASYYRMVGAGMQMGTGARGLAFDSGQIDRAEEFPIFTDFWLHKPQAGAKELQVFALLNSVSCTGAYEFIIRPGFETETLVRAIIYFREPAQIKEADPNRKPVVTLGMAPLTSMFWYGENTFRKWHDFRPEVHDADGLLIKSDAGEVTWRSLSNPPGVRHSVFPMRNVRGFGLIQRDRDFGSYHDISRPYHQVPSVWVEPQGDWGEGNVHLMEFATGNEALDNVVAFWDPQERPKPMEPFEFAYRQIWTGDPKISDNRVTSVRFGAESSIWLALVDFDGPAIRALDDKTPPKVVATCGDTATLISAEAVRNPHGAPWRAVIRFEPKGKAEHPVEIRCHLEHEGKPISEKWAYVWDAPTTQGTP